MSVAISVPCGALKVSPIACTTLPVSGSTWALSSSCTVAPITNAAATTPPLETVRFVYHTIKWCYEPSGAEYVDSWSSSDAA